MVTKQKTSWYIICKEQIFPVIFALIMLCSGFIGLAILMGIKIIP